MVRQVSNHAFSFQVVDNAPERRNIHIYISVGSKVYTVVKYENTGTIPISSILANKANGQDLDHAMKVYKLCACVSR